MFPQGPRTPGIRPVPSSDSLSPAESNRGSWLNSSRGWRTRRHTRRPGLNRSSRRTILLSIMVGHVLDSERSNRPAAITARGPMVTAFGRGMRREQARTWRETRPAVRATWKRRPDPEGRSHLEVTDYRADVSLRSKFYDHAAVSRLETHRVFCATGTRRQNRCPVSASVRRFAVRTGAFNIFSPSLLPRKCV